LAGFMLPQKSRTRQITMAAVLAAVYFVLRSVPTFEMVGLSARFTAGDFILPAIAIIAGPWAGAVSVIIGTIIGYAVRPPIFFGIDFLPGAVNVVVLGFVLSDRRQAARATYAAVLAVFLLSPYSLLFGYAQIPYTWLHIIAFIVLISPVAAKLPVWLKLDETHQLFSVVILAFIGTMVQHLTGGLLYEVATGYVGGIDPRTFQQLWRVIFWLYPVERLIIVAVSTFLAAGLYRTIRQSRL